MTTEDNNKSKQGFFTTPDKLREPALAVNVDSNLEKSMKNLKRKVIKEGLFRDIKLRAYFEKPSVKKKRKTKESLKRIRKERSRLRRSLIQ